MRNLSVYQSQRLDRRIRLRGLRTKGEDGAPDTYGINVVVWAARLEHDQRSDLTDFARGNIIAQNAISTAYLVRWRADVATAFRGVTAGRSLKVYPDPDDTDRGFGVDRIEEVGRRRFQKLHLALR